ncbi:hydroxysqualene dehydroxylase HpnE [Thalassoroseus pseudoceratinae]|uniref:hydroxysqualene dehydroxylase HpnE n=1 Tax=Thalassoroseus pseudoceratinae TaxID=2713176 RepID=UPI001421EA5E|nr:hydroxysqualene dehydroxylase HpnE [Thalassoroseus pseudoceratinae]
MSNRENRVVVIGGGLAGLAATTALAARGYPVTLLESRPRLGGRASSFVDQTTGQLIDNCQHVNMGCCTNFRHFCETVGIADRLERQSALYFIGPDGQQTTFSASWLPTPLHLLPAFRRLTYLSRNDLRGIAWGLKSLAKPLKTAESQDETFASWLSRHDQTPNAIERFWFVVLVSALSETLDRIDVASARKVFVDGFMASRDGWTVEIPTVPLSEFYGETLREWLENHSVDVKLLTGVRELKIANDHVTHVELRDGSTIEGDDFVLAVPHHRVQSLLPESWREHPEVQAVDDLESAPISSVHLWFDRPVTDLPHAVLIEKTSQWLFNRGLTDESSPFSGHYYQVVISASRDLSGRSSDEIVREVVEELKSVWPNAAEANLLHSRFVTEHRAVFSVRPESRRCRLPQQSPIPNLQFAGDWTRTGWPATMEGAVRSGYFAASNILGKAAEGKMSVVQPDLPTAWLSRRLFGLSKNPPGVSE